MREIVQIDPHSIPDNASLADVLAWCRRLENTTFYAGESPFPSRMVVDVPATEDEIASAWHGAALPASLTTVWQMCRSARFFEDIAYGQWGLVLLSPAESAERTGREQATRPTDMRETDIVVADFRGDSDLVLVSRVEEEVLIADAIYHRSDWCRVTRGFDDFLVRYVGALGRKFWEEHRHS